METIGDRIRNSRGARPKAEVARAVGVDPSAYYRWEAGTAMPDSTRLVVLADTLGVGVRWLLTGEHEPAASTDAA